MNLIGVSHDPSMSRKKKWLFFILLLLIVGALCRPYWGSRMVNHSGVGARIIVALDISRSMLVSDVHPDRLELAKRKILDLVRYAEKNDSRSQIGLVLFAGSAYLYCPQTNDFSVLRTYINAITTDLIQDQGSDLTSAITEGKAALGQDGGSILVLSDGEDLSFDQGQLNTLLSNSGIRIFTVGFGTEKGAPVPSRTGGFIRDERNTIVISKRSDEVLSQIADASGGVFSDAALDDSDIEPVFATGDTINITEPVLQRDEFGFVLLILAALTATVSIWRGVFLALLISSCFSQAASAESSRQSYEGGNAYQHEQYEQAVTDFENASKEEPDNADILQGLGSSQFKAGDLSGAQKSFEKLGSIAKKPQQQFDARYNLGNSLLAEKKYEDAVKAYDNALSVNPDDVRAKTNRSIAQELLKQMQQDKQNQQNKEDNKDQQNDQNQQQEQSQQNQDQEGNQDQKQNNQSRDDSKNGPDKKEGDTGKEETEENDQKEQVPQKAEDKESQDEKTAQRWIDSLPDAPVALRRKNGKKNSVTGQSW